MALRVDEFIPWALVRIRPYGVVVEVFSSSSQSEEGLVIQSCCGDVQPVDNGISHGALLHKSVLLIYVEIVLPDLVGSDVFTGTGIVPAFRPIMVEIGGELAGVKYLLP